MASLNRATLIGNLGKDPEIRYTPDGAAVCNVSIATTSTWRDKASDERREKPNGTASCSTADWPRSQANT